MGTAPFQQKLYDDLTALEKAQELCGNYEIEIWQAARRVARLSKDGTGSLQPDSKVRAQLSKRFRYLVLLHQA
jgi:hypothetical protein